MVEGEDLSIKRWARDIVDSDVGKTVLGAGGTTRRKVSLGVSAVLLTLGLVVAQGHDNGVRNQPSPPASPSPTVRK